MTRSKGLILAFSLKSWLSSFPCESDSIKSEPGGRGFLQNFVQHSPEERGNGLERGVSIAATLSIELAAIAFKLLSSLQVACLPLTKPLSLSPPLPPSLSSSLQAACLPTKSHTEPSIPPNATLTDNNAHPTITPNRAMLTLDGDSRHSNRWHLRKKLKASE
ncbi:hypothetical protein D8674_006836 [Pyrus ussuriensis x Pyrus communis]|uniref:Uncharacterized protein n=1 Tax=Pyrus ussuriensis x Pyrus communis TaxID=2448454 RepID=A0A5N5FVI1_9ROSA|nr:hypothetical protein D8674_006836 [Pyrus ussuriensis x Pyrus communis]